MMQVLNPVLCDNLEWWDGVCDGRKVQEGGDIYVGLYWCMVETHNIVKHYLH